MGMLCSMYLSFSCPFLFCVCVYSIFWFGVLWGFFFFLVCKMEIVAVPTSMDCFRGYRLISTCFVFLYFFIKRKAYESIYIDEDGKTKLQFGKMFQIFQDLSWARFFLFFLHSFFFSSFLAESMIYGSNFFLFIS